MKKLLVLLLGVAVVSMVAGQSIAAEIEPALAEKLDTVYRTDEVIKVVLIMKDKLPGLNMRSPGSRDTVIRYLQRQSESSQRNVLDFINISTSHRGEKSNVRVRSFWLANFVVVEGPLSLVRNLTANEDIEKIVLEKSFQVIEPVPSGKKSIELPYGHPLMGVDEVWKQFALDGTGVKVGIIDTGINMSLGYAQEHLVAGKGFSNGQMTNNFADGQGHGTHVAGTICGGLVDDTLYKLMWGAWPVVVGPWRGKIGVAPGIELYVGKVLGDNGSGTFEDIIAGIEWMIDPDGNPETDDGVDIINASLGASESVPELREPLVNAQATGVFLCFAAGNSGQICGSPADFPEIFAIGAVDSADRKASFSSIGPVQFDGQEHIKPNVMAPGVEVISYYKDRLMGLNGTSMACPNAVGVMSLLLQADPTMNVDEMKSLLVETAVDGGAAGPDNQYGYGRIDALAAARKAMANREAGLVLGRRLALLAELELDRLWAEKNRDTNKAFRLLKHQARLRDIIVSFIAANSLDNDTVSAAIGQVVTPDTRRLFDLLKLSLKEARLKGRLGADN